MLILLIHLVAEGCQLLNRDAPLSEDCVSVILDFVHRLVSDDSVVQSGVYQILFRFVCIHEATSRLEPHYRLQASFSGDTVVGHA